MSDRGGKYLSGSVLGIGKNRRRGLGGLGMCTLISVHHIEAWSMNAAARLRLKRFPLQWMQVS